MTKPYPETVDDIVRYCYSDIGVVKDIVTAQRDWLAARLAEVERERDALRALIDEHNKGCESACASRKKSGYCAPYVERRRNCPDCPEDDRIELPDSARGCNVVGCTNPLPHDHEIVGPHTDAL